MTPVDVPKLEEIFRTAVSRRLRLQDRKDAVLVSVPRPRPSNTIHKAAIPYEPPTANQIHFEQYGEYEVVKDGDYEKAAELLGNIAAGMWNGLAGAAAARGSKIISDLDTLHFMAKSLTPEDQGYPATSYVAFTFYFGAYAGPCEFDKHSASSLG